VSPSVLVEDSTRAVNRIIRGFIAPPSPRPPRQP
jgi:hypothetical protein